MMPRKEYEALRKSKVSDGTVGPNTGVQYGPTVKNAWPGEKIADPARMSDDELLKLNRDDVNRMKPEAQEALSRRLKALGH
jgi:hypothetical protein